MKLFPKRKIISSVKIFFSTVVLAFFLASGMALATNGDNLIGIGPISRAMGGVGIAMPQDPLSAVFANPAAMCHAAYCPGSEAEFAGTVFIPVVTASVQSPQLGVDAGARSQAKPFIIPAVAIAEPLGRRWRFAFAAYGVSGLGVDYRDRMGLAPVNGSDSVFTQYSVMKFAPNIAYEVTDRFSLGASLQLDYASLDMGGGSSPAYALGAQAGALYRAKPFAAGFSYTSPQNIRHERVVNSQNDFKLDEPQTAGLGIAWFRGDFIIEADIKWIDWGGAAGYNDMDWSDQWVYALGAQVSPFKKIKFRAGVNYGANPIRTHNGFDASSTINVQGTVMPRFNYESLRIIGFPAIAETHITAGMEYCASRSVNVDVGYMHAFKNSISETGVNWLGAGNQVKLGSTMYEDSIDFGVTWSF